MRIAIAEMSNEALLRGLLDALPAFVLLVDEDVSILEYNAAAGKLLGTDRHAVLRRRGGEALHCIHSTDSPDGCGRGGFCRNCLVRNSVNEAFAQGKTVRRRVRLELSNGSRSNELDFVLTAAPFAYQGHRRVVLVLDDLSGLVEL